MAKIKKEPEINTRMGIVKNGMFVEVPRDKIDETLRAISTPHFEAAKAAVKDCLNKFREDSKRIIGIEDR